MSPRTVKKIAQHYNQVLRENNFSCTRIFVFGSQATGNARKDSDIDIAVVVKRRSKFSLEKQMLLRRFAIKVDTRIEPILLEEREFKRGEESIIATAVKRHGIQVR